MIRWGKFFRERRRVRYWELVRRNISMGMVH
jgi:hypothetical protein